MVAGAPGSPGMYATRVRLPSGFKVMPHSHPEDRLYTVLSGTWTIGLGGEMDSTTLTRLGPGETYVLPAGTVLHVISWHDNSANKINPDPRNWVGSGNRTIDEMGFAWITWYDMNDDEYKAELDSRKGAKTTSTAQQPQ